MKGLRSIHRRDFLKKVPLALAGTAGFPTIIKASALGMNGAVPASDRIVMAGIGYGMQGPGDMQNFVDCVRSRALTIAPAEVAHRSASVGHLGVTAIETGRKIKWNPATETIIGDPEAERLLSRSYRKPWQMPA
jgi:hypothetical protein